MSALTLPLDSKPKGDQVREPGRRKGAVRVIAVRRRAIWWMAEGSGDQISTKIGNYAPTAVTRAARQKMKKYREDKRERYLTKEELQQLGAALVDAEQGKTESPFAESHPQRMHPANFPASLGLQTAWLRSFAVLSSIEDRELAFALKSALKSAC